MRAISEIVAQLRKERGMSQKELADAAGMSTSAVSCLENGEWLMSTSTALAFANVFGVSLDALCDHTIDHKRRYWAIQYSDLPTKDVPFKDIVKAYRGKAGITRAELAEKIDCDTHTVANWEIGKSRPKSLEMCASIADLFGISIDALLGRE